MPYSENPTMQAALQNFEMIKQTAIQAAAGNAASIRAAEISYFRSARASAIANACGMTQFTDALHELGTGGT
jgi:hypothetical protein